MYYKLQDMYDYLFHHIANPIAKELSETSRTMNVDEAKRLMSFIFEVFLDEELNCL